MIIESDSVFVAWKRSLQAILDRGKDFFDENKRICREYLGLLINLSNLSDITKPIKILNSFKHWKYPPLEEIAAVMLSHGLSPDYHYSYGTRLFSFQGQVNQIDDYVIPLLQQIPTSRRACVSVFDPTLDSDLLRKDTPGLISLDFKLKNNKLNLFAIIRSNDLFFGWPANVYQLFVLQDYVRQKLNCQLGGLRIFSTSAHLFEDQYPFIKEIMKKS